MTGTILGIEIGRDGVKAVVFDRTFKGFSVNQSGYAGYRSSGGHDPAQDPQSRAVVDNWAVLLENALNELASQLDFSRCSAAAVTLSASFFSFRHINLPFTSKNRIKQVLAFELSPFLPLVDETYVSEFTVLPPLTPEEETGLFTASMPKSTLETLFSPLRKFGLKPELVTPSGYAIARHVTKRQKIHGTLLFVHLDENSATATLCVENEIVLVRSIRHLKDCASVTRGLEQTLTGFNQRTGRHLSPSRLFVTWGSSRDRELVNGLKGFLGCDVEFPEIDRSGQNNGFQESRFYANSLCAVFSWAESNPGFNFCKGDYAADSFFRKQMKNLAVAGFLGVMVFAGLLFTIHADISLAEKKIARLDKAATRVFQENFPGRTRIVDPVMQMKVSVNEVKKNAGRGEGGQGSGNSPRLRGVDILLELSDRIPDALSVKIDRFVLNPHRIILSGKTDDFNNVDRIKGAVQPSNMFRQVKISSAAADKTGSKVRFKFIIDI